MLDRIRLVNFKCYRDAEIALAPLTVLSGMNAVGKSTILQAVNFMRQLSARHIEIPCGLVSTEGSLVSFGTVDELINVRAPRDEETEVKIELHGDRAADCGFLSLSRLCKDDPDSRSRLLVRGGSFPDGLLFGADFLYLGADRLSPNEKFPFNESDEQRALNLLGNRGEYAPWYLGLKTGIGLPNPDVRCPDSAPEQVGLEQQVGAWMSRLGREVRIWPSLYEDIKVAGVRFEFVEGVPYSPRNVGFGLTHSLPIFVALLSRPKGSIVLLENPESHLHPKAQVAMGEFISRMVSCGIQVIVETHSDHILNGIRLAVRRRILVPDQVGLDFMALDSQDGDVRPIVPRILPSGAINIWPEGFFDEYENVSAELL